MATKKPAPNDTAPPGVPVSPVAPIAEAAPPASAAEVLVAPQEPAGAPGTAPLPDPPAEAPVAPEAPETAAHMAGEVEAAAELAAEAPNSPSAADLEAEAIAETVAHAREKTPEQRAEARAGLARLLAALAELDPPAEVPVAPPVAATVIAPPGAVEARPPLARELAREITPATFEPDASRRSGVIVAVPAGALDSRVAGVIVARQATAGMDSTGARLAEVVASSPAIVATAQAIRDPQAFDTAPRAQVAIEAGAAAPLPIGAVPAVQALAAGELATPAAEPAPVANDPIGRARAQLDQINGNAQNLQRAALELADADPRRAALLEQAGVMRGQAAAIYATLG